LSIYAILIKMCADLAILPIGSRSEASLLFEDSGQMALVGKAALYRNLSKGRIRLFQQLLRSLNSLAQHKVVRAFAGHLPEQAGKVVRTKASLLSQCFK
jgi:hypothetical protein